jgi:hypothetical protein
MARIEIGECGRPTCPGCGAEFHVLHHLLNSRIRGMDPYPDAYKRGDHSSAPEIAAFAAAHASCPETSRCVSVSNGITIIDKRRYACT